MTDKREGKKESPLTLKLDHTGLGESGGTWKVTLAATLLQGSKFIADRTVKFFVNFLPVGDAKTTEDGIAHFMYEGAAKPTHVRAILDGTATSAAMILQHPTATRLRRDKINITPHGAGGKYSLSVSIGADDCTPIKDVQIRVFGADKHEPVDSKVTDENGHALIDLPKFSVVRKDFLIEIEALPPEKITLKGPMSTKSKKAAKENNRRALRAWAFVVTFFCFNAGVIGIRPSRSVVAELTAMPPEAIAYYNHLYRDNYSDTELEEAKKGLVNETSMETWKDDWRWRFWIVWLASLLGVVIYTPIAYREETLYPLLSWLRDMRTKAAISHDLPDPVVAGDRPAEKRPKSFLKNLTSGLGKFLVFDLAVEAVEKFLERRILKK